MSGKSIPYTRFSTGDLPVRDRFAKWRESISVLYEVTERDHSPFRADVGAILAGGLFASEVAFSAQRFVRTRGRLAADGIDHYQIQLYESGGEGNDAGECRPGDIQLLDLGRPHAAETKAADSIVVMVARDAIRGLLPEAGSLHHAVLRRETAACGLLADYLRALMRQLPLAKEAEAPAIEQATLAMIAACFRPTVESMELARTAVDTTTAERARQYIERNLRSPDLGPDAICRALRISRSRLYALFEPQGGVARYIWERRLDRARAELAGAASAGRTVGEIAFGWGFTSLAHFSRAFRRAFGLSPSDMRNPAGKGARVTLAEPARAEGGYDDWIRHRVMAARDARANLSGRTVNRGPSEV
ncbi:MAG TPA: helix-turn-helix domain-containing protein [Bryobacteraceae bacterium]|jgi:AraC-like DNA-binding protein|nr:helix-turn-helix domain-containing protein [Bryobacteraceae bacterium]